MDVIPLDACAINAREEITGLELVAPRHVYHLTMKRKEDVMRWSLALRANVPHVTRFNGFAPPRKGISAKWYINGATYFTEVADAMEAANRYNTSSCCRVVPHFALGGSLSLTGSCRLSCR